MRTPARASLNTIDATCPLVTKVHVEARKFAADGYTIVLVGHEGHEEVEGTTGEAPEHIVLVQTEEDVERLEVADPDKVAFITQTTLSVDETMGIIRRLRERFPNMVGPRTDDICYATQNRQDAVKQLAPRCDLVLVIGSRNSSNSNRLVEVARQHGASSYLIDNEHEVREEWLDGVETVGITSGASAPEELVQRLVEFFRERGARGRLGAGGDRGGRALHAPQGHPPAAHRAGLIRRVIEAARLAFSLASGCRETEHGQRGQALRCTRSGDRAAACAVDRYPCCTRGHLHGQHDRRSDRVWMHRRDVFAAAGDQRGECRTRW